MVVGVHLFAVMYLYRYVCRVFVFRSSSMYLFLYGVIYSVRSFFISMFLMYFVSSLFVSLIVMYSLFVI